MTSFLGLRNRTRRTRNALGSTGTTSPPRTMHNSRSRTSRSAKLKISGFWSVIKPSPRVRE